MKICPNCNKQLIDSARFCDGCGSPVQEAPASEPAPQPAWEAPASEPAPQYAEHPHVQQASAKKKKPLNKKLLIIGAIAAAVLVAGIILLFCLLGGGKQDYTIYIKDGDLCYNDFSGNTIVITDDAAENNVTLSEDGKKLFYIEDDDDTLYFRYLDGVSSPVKIDTNVTKYVINDDADLITYLRKDGDEKILCQHDLNGRIKISSDNVTGFWVTRDGETIIYQTADEDLYFASSEGKGEKISGDVSDVLKVSKDLSKIYYLKDDKLYLKDGEKNDVIARDVFDVVKMYDSGDFYYVKNALSEEDKNLSYSNYEVYDNYGNIDLEKTLDNMIKVYGLVGYELIYNDGEKDTKIADVSRYSYQAAEDKAVVCYAVVDHKAATEDATVSNYGELFSSSELKKHAKYYIAVETTPLEVVGAEGLLVFSNGEKAMYWKDMDDKDTVTLCTVEISSDKLNNNKVVDENVRNIADVTEDGKIFYIKNYDSDKRQGDLYVDGKLVDSDVYMIDFDLLEDSGVLLYYVDYNSDKSKGTLMSATTDGKTTKICDDVHEFRVSLDEKILCIKDYKNNKGDLFVSTDGKEARRLTEDVREICSYYNYTRANNQNLGYED